MNHPTILHVIQINSEMAGDRAAALMTLQQLRAEAARIQAEIDRLTRSMQEQIEAADLKRG